MEKRASGDRDILFEVHSITCVRVRTTERYWRYVVEIKHPESFSEVEEAEEKAKNTLQNPEIVVKALSLQFICITNALHDILYVLLRNILTERDI